MRTWALILLLFQPFPCPGQDGKGKLTATVRHFIPVKTSGTFTFMAMPDAGDMVYYATGARTIGRWSMAGGVQSPLEGTGEFSYTALAVDAEGKILVAAGKSNLTFWDLRTGKVTKSIKAPGGRIQALAVNRQGSMLAWTSGFPGGGPVIVWDLVNHQLKHTLEWKKNPPDWGWTIAFSADGALVAVGHEEGVVRVWDTDSGILKRTFTGHAQPIHDICFAPDGKYVASGSLDGTARVWDIASGRAVKVMKHDSNFYAVGIDPTGKFLATGHGDGTVRLWDLISGREQQVLKAHDGWTESILISRNGKRLLSGSSEGIKIWDLGP